MCDVATSKEASPLRVEVEEDGALLRLTLDRPKGNIIDTEMVEAIRAELSCARTKPALRAVLFSGEGKHFSFGASVEEHQVEQVGEMLPTFHALFRDLLDSNLVLLAAVRGQCLGGGLELASFCHRVFADPNARLGQPEIQLGVLAPVASLVLPLRCGQAAADDLLLSGRSVTAEEALGLGLIDELAEDPIAAALTWHRENLASKSAVALRHAVRAGRTAWRRTFLEELPHLERYYLDSLMATQDAREGIASFLEKRKPNWSHT